MTLSVRFRVAAVLPLIFAAFTIDATGKDDESFWLRVLRVALNDNVITEKPVVTVRSRSAWMTTSDDRNAASRMEDTVEWHTQVRTVSASGPNGTKYRAVCDWDLLRSPDDEIRSLAKQSSRYDYGTHRGRSYHHSNVYVTREGSDSIDLWFPDVGAHTHRPHSIAFDDDGNLHLAICAVDPADDNTTSIYWLVGDARKRRWLRARKVATSLPWTMSATPKFAKSKGQTYLFWSWMSSAPKTERQGEGIYIASMEPSSTFAGRVLEGRYELWDVADQSGECSFGLVGVTNDSIQFVWSDQDGVSLTELSGVTVDQLHNVYLSPLDGSFELLLSGGNETTRLKFNRVKAR